MPFSEPGSNAVYEDLIQPAIAGAGLCCARDNEPVRVGGLTESVGKQILKAGVVIADVSAPNVNVFYELGLVDALGKDMILLKEERSTLTADFRGTLYYEYALDRLRTTCDILCQKLGEWKIEHRRDG